LERHVRGVGVAVPDAASVKLMLTWISRLHCVQRMSVQGDGACKQR
jgi:hypothetical protein